MLESAVRMDAIVVRGAREHNLKNLHLEIPRNRLVVITGVSGSGKSSLAFDTLFAEGQRRYVESLSAYARQFLPQVEKPDVDAIDGLSPAISIEQKSVSRNPRSTVGTVTEIHDYLRLLYASIGIPHCPSCGQEIRPQTVQQMVDRLLGASPRAPGSCSTRPTCAARRASTGSSSPRWRARGSCARASTARPFDLSKEIPALDKQKKHTIDILVDRLVVKPGLDKRLADSLETALKVGSGLVVAAPEGLPEETLSQNFSCATCGTSLSEITPRLFSFNSPYGACPTCSGLGTLMGVDPEKVVTDPERSIDAGALSLFQPGSKSWRLRMIETLAKAMGFSLRTPWNRLSAKAASGHPAGQRRAGARVRVQGQEVELQVGGQVRGRRADARAALPRVRLPGRARRDREVHVGPASAPTARGGGCGPRRWRSPSPAHAIDELTTMPVADLRRLVPTLDALRPRARDRRQGPAGDRRPARLPRRRRRRLPDARPLLGDALGRREPAHPPRDPDRLEADGRALRARRAVDRPPPARQRPPHRDPQGHARPRQHGAGRRARRGHHPAPPTGCSTSGPAPASTAESSSPAGTPEQVAEAPRLAHRPVPARRARGGGAAEAPRRQRQEAHHRRRAAQQSARLSTSSSRSAPSRW